MRPQFQKRSSQFHNTTMDGLIFPTNFSTKREEAGRTFENKWYQGKRKEINIFLPLDME